MQITNNGAWESDAISYQELYDGDMWGFIDYNKLAKAMIKACQSPLVINIGDFVLSIFQIDIWA